ncbi:DUF3566 domain-containing protein [Actinopolyspora halophila]|uniref:DUF3566 domain-containing protein n=1 Tax=Actinopolyspora halophila TaxID=1850 RepID=UPI000399E353|nr:DUF3566 domain-containing protein [Actinopolyspora halophila]
MTSSDKPQESESRSTGEQDTTSTTTTAEATATSVSGDTSADTAESGVDAGGRSDSDSEVDGSEPAPPWQRVTSSTSSSAAPSGGSGQETTTRGAAESSEAASETGSDSEETHKIPHPLRGSSEPEEGASAAESARSSVSFAAMAGVRGSGTSTQGSSSRRPNRGPRRASLQVRRVDPWSVLKLALVLSVTLFFVWMIAVAVLYGVLGGMGVWEQLNGTFSDLTQPENSLAEPLISPGRIFGVAMIIGAVNIVLITALATVAGFIYNVAADFVGGVELTLSERE